MRNRGPLAHSLAQQPRNPLRRNIPHTSSCSDAGAAAGPVASTVPSVGSHAGATVPPAPRHNKWHTRLCPCGAEAVVIDGDLRLCYPHSLAIAPADLYRMERAKRAEAHAAHAVRLRAIVAEADRQESDGLAVMGLRRIRRRTPPLAVGRRLHG